jgi:hypothetical protein
LKLWQDALAALGIEKKDLIRDLTRADKYHLGLHQEFHNQPNLLRALVLLERANEGEVATLESMQGIEAFQTVMASLYRPEMGMSSSNRPEQLLSKAVRLANQIMVYRYRRPWALTELDRSLEPLVWQIEQAATINAVATNTTNKQVVKEMTDLTDPENYLVRSRVNQ